MRKSDAVPREEEHKCFNCWNKVNTLVTFIGYAIVMIDFEGESVKFSFVVDCIDITASLCCGVVAIAGIVLQLKMSGKLTKILIADVIITGVSLSGVIYEIAIADSF